MTDEVLVDAVDAALPQTQCTRCGYDDCRAYAVAVGTGAAEINRCPPGGEEGVRRLAVVTRRPVLPLDAACGEEGPLRRARIVEDQCIGCTLCLIACPVDAIVGAAKRLHQVIADQCTGCALCLPACPVDCITLEADQPERTGWDAWRPHQAEQARRRYQAHRQRTNGSDLATADDRLRVETGAPLQQPLLDGAAGANEARRRLLSSAMARARSRGPAA